jgi:Fe-S-cluster containining protein
MTRKDNKRRLPIFNVFEELDGAMRQLEKACKAGCDYCCRSGMRVKVTAEEADVIARRLQRDPTLISIRERVVSGAARTREMTNGQYWEAKVACPFLENGNCSIYDVRPVSCRAWTSMDVNGCIENYEQKHIEGQGATIRADTIRVIGSNVKFIDGPGLGTALLLKYGLLHRGSAALSGQELVDNRGDLLQEVTKRLE